MKIVRVPIADIVVADRLRPTDPDAVRALSLNIETDGLRHPIEVSKTESGYRLVAGAHRLAACRALGWADLPAVVVAGNAGELRLRELTDNLVRRDLTALERAQGLAALRRLYQEDHPATRRGGYDRSLKSLDKA
jgi:ParB family chromosome partitioning protein